MSKIAQPAAQEINCQNFAPFLPTAISGGVQSVLWRSRKLSTIGTCQNLDGWPPKYWHVPIVLNFRDRQRTLCTPPDMAVGKNRAKFRHFISWAAGWAIFDIENSLHHDHNLQNNALKRFKRFAIEGVCLTSTDRIGSIWIDFELHSEFDNDWHWKFICWQDFIKITKYFQFRQHLSRFVWFFNTFDLKFGPKKVGLVYTFSSRSTFVVVLGTFPWFFKQEGSAQIF